MIDSAGTVTLALAALASAGCLVAGAVAARDERCGALRWSVRLITASSLLFLIAAGLLAMALARLDFTLRYVADHLDASPGVLYRFAALWSGQEGSLLLWAVLSSASFALFAAGQRRAPLHGARAMLTVGAVINLLFAGLLLFVADPFALSAVPVSTGRGLNPQLQHWAMIIHPPLLFAGYACSALPAAIVAGGLLSRDLTPGHLAAARRWTLVAWTFLTAGISVGAWWAYVELGWGGYWAWDPVENASLLPWLTSTALLHTLPVHRHRGVLKGWTAGLALATLLLCYTGAYITRSGVIESVHAFGRSTIGGVLLIAIVAGLAGSIWLLVSRRALLAPDRPEGRLLSREGITLIGVLILCSMAAATLLGTFFPVLSGAAMTTAVSVGPGFFNRVVSPLGLVLTGLLVVAPVLTFGPVGPGVLARSLRWPAAAAVWAAGVSFAAGARSPWFMVAAAIGSAVAFGIAASLIGSVSEYARRTGFGWFGAAARLIDANHRRYGGHLAHVGVGVLVIGIAGSSLLSEEATQTLARGETLRIAGRELRLEEVRQVNGAGYVAAEAVITVDPSGPSARTIRPQRRFYDTAEDAVAEVAIKTTWREDLYVALLGWEDAGARAALQARINPLTAWIWTGAGLMVAGGLLSLTPRLLRPRAAQSAADFLPARRQARTALTSVPARQG